MYAIQSKLRTGVEDMCTPDIYACITAGTAQDVSYLIDFLPSYLFPAGERKINQWLVGGKSLGGHSTWIALRHGRRHLLLRG